MKMKIDYPCPVIRDLLPLYAGTKTSSETKAVVENHLKSCTGCSTFFDSFKDGRIPPVNPGNSVNPKISEAQESANAQENAGFAAMESPDCKNELANETDRYVKIARKIKQRKIMTVLITAFLFVLALVATFRFYTPVLISGHSMSPSMQDGKITILNKLTYRFSTPNRYDVIAYQEDGLLHVGRIIALPGETVRIADGTISAGDTALRHAALSDLPKALNQDFLLTGAGQYLVMKDNDLSTSPQLVDGDDIIGKFRVE